MITVTGVFVGLVLMVIIGAALTPMLRLNFWIDLIIFNYINHGSVFSIGDYCIWCSD